tara:strand:+ start:113 stop:1789 length:1677 start_codon:yes stop_codon:yes gene_type:complete
MGRRMLKRRLINPFVDVSKIEKCYEEIEKLNGNYQQLEKVLDKIPDLDRILQKFKMNNINENDVGRYLSCILDFDKDYPNELSPDIVNEINKLFVFKDEMEFVEDTELKKLKDEIDSTEKKLNEITKSFNEPVKLEKTENSGYQILTTPTRGEKIKKKHKVKIIKINTNSVKISTDEIDNLCYNLTRVTQDYKDLYTKTLRFCIKTLIESVDTSLVQLHKFIAELDVIKSNTKTSVKYRYTRPVLNKLTKGFINSKGIRHPIIEQLNCNYVPNDARFDENCKGLLLYGMNGSGKSCYGKSIALNLILAQIGCYVAAESFEYGIYNNVFTRITCDDNMYKGMSSFEVEMNELSSIIQAAGKNSFVVGDEMCKGTEDLSAVSIVSSVLDWMTIKNVHFVIATHLHKLTDIDFIKNNKSIAIKHLKTSYDKTLQKIVYNRKLEDGQGDSLYGIEIAKQILNFPSVTNKAMEARHMLLNKNSNLVSTKKSRYNKNVYLSECKNCKSTKNLHTHHIIYQCEDPLFKNNKNNLVVVCEACHHKIHNNQLALETVDTGKIEYIFK